MQILNTFPFQSTENIDSGKKLLGSGHKRISRKTNEALSSSLKNDLFPFFGSRPCTCAMCNVHILVHDSVRRTSADFLSFFYFKI